MAGFGAHLESSFGLLSNQKIELENRTATLLLWSKHLFSRVPGETQAMICFYLSERGKIRVVCSLQPSSCSPVEMTWPSNTHCQLDGNVQFVSFWGRLSLKPRLASNEWQSHVSFWSTGSSGVCQHAPQEFVLIMKQGRRKVVSDDRLPQGMLRFSLWDLLPLLKSPVAVRVTHVEKSLQVTALVPQGPCLWTLSVIGSTVVQPRTEDWFKTLYTQDMHRWSTHAWESEHQWELVSSTSLFCSVLLSDITDDEMASVVLDWNGRHYISRKEAHEDTVGLWPLSLLSPLPEVQLAHLDLLTCRQLSLQPVSNVHPDCTQIHPGHTHLFTCYRCYPQVGSLLLQMLLVTRSEWNAS